jgi:hypothetical protein
MYCVKVSFTVRDQKLEVETKSDNPHIGAVIGEILTTVYENINPFCDSDREFRSPYKNRKPEK